MVTVLMMWAKMATLDFLKIQVFGIKGYNVTTSVYDVINKNLSHDSNFIVHLVMWTDLTRKTTFLRGGLGQSLKIYDWH